MFAYYSTINIKNIKILIQKFVGPICRTLPKFVEKKICRTLPKGKLNKFCLTLDEKLGNVCLALPGK